MAASGAAPGRVAVCLNDAAQAYERGEFLEREALAHNQAHGAKLRAELAAQTSSTAGMERTQKELLAHRQQRIAASQGVVTSTAEARHHYHAVMHNVALRESVRASEALQTSSHKHRQAELVLASARLSADAAGAAVEHAEREKQSLASNALRSRQQADALEREAYAVEVLRNEQRAQAVAAHARAAYTSATERINATLAAKAGQNAAAALSHSETKALAHTECNRRCALAEEVLAAAVAKEREARALEVAAAAELATYTKEAEVCKAEAEEALAAATSAEQEAKEASVVHQVAAEASAEAAREATEADSHRQEANSRLATAELELAEAIEKSTAAMLSAQVSQSDVESKQAAEVLARSNAIEASNTARQAARSLLQSEQSLGRATAREADTKRDKDNAVVEACVQQQRHSDESIALASARVIEHEITNKATQITAYAREASQTAYICTSVARELSHAHTVHEASPPRKIVLDTATDPELSAHLAAASARRVAEMTLQCHQ
eukprot:TRINITY_DN23087_c0_g1_i1.p1 TRINITY_DN23087_c0_g1~~TRINITY_DN23087_c0_g1_i1.p1  ORF type:complete len:501 (+),score=186.43 TRINITY_DN23087_c0_g1_i1:44-1546(+)